MGGRSRLGRRSPTLPPDVEAAVRARIIPLASLHSGTDRDDLAAWGRTLDGVRVVGLGEATHGTREFFTLKHRLVEHLVLEHGFTVVAFEADADGCRPLDAYVTTGCGDPVHALRELGYWTWNTEEVLDMLHWLRAHNARTPAESAVRFVGVDPTDERRRRSATRDRAMAEAVLDLARRDQARVAFWAHNGHVSTWAHAAGAHLRDELGTAYYPLALTFHHGTFQALRITLRGLRGPQQFTAPEPRHCSIEDTLGRLAGGDFVLDLRNTADCPALHAWATTKQQMRAYGSIALPGPLANNQMAPVIPARDFDGIAFVRSASRARPLVIR